MYQVHERINRMKVGNIHCLGVTLAVGVLAFVNGIPHPPSPLVMMLCTVMPADFYYETIKTSLGSISATPCLV